MTRVQSSPISATRRASGNGVIDADRLWQDIMALGEITDAGRPYTRRCFTDTFLTGRHWLGARFTEAGLAVRLDAGANLIARLEGSEPALPAILIGSHSDTVPSGGRFDGALGVLIGLEVVRALQQRGIRLRHAVEVIDFLSEEPSDYGLSCIGSRAMSGRLESDMLAFTNAAGESLAAAMQRMGASVPEVLAAQRSDIAAYLEVHIEQGRVLEESKTDVGIVTSIVGIMRTEITFAGSADHAGTTPFHLRRDALLAAAEVVIAVRRIGETLVSKNEGYFIATVGYLDVVPNAANVVPGQTRLVVECRAECDDHLSAFWEQLDQSSMAAATVNNVDRATFRRISRTQPVRCSERLRAHIAQAAVQLDISSISLASGAGHDAAFVAAVAPAAMVLVPSRDGRSHCPEEWTEQEQCAHGANVLFEALLRLDADNAFDHCGNELDGGRYRQAEQ
jgi:N-carbamoyl-L-amino-acid hydrolase